MRFVQGNSADLGLQPVGEIQSKRLRRPLAMTESSPTATVENQIYILESIGTIHQDLNEFEIRMDRLFEAIEALDKTFDKMTGLLQIIADREY